MRSLRPPSYDDYWGGRWTDVSYSSGSDITTLTGSFGTKISGVNSVREGDVVVPNLKKPMALFVAAVTVNDSGADTLEIAGDVTAFVSAADGGDWFRIHQASQYQYDKTTNTMAPGPCSPQWGGRYLWSGYRRMPGISQTAGQDPYYCWNRWYLPSTGRWTTPDPAMSPWGNLTSYALENGLAKTDSSGLQATDDKKYRDASDNKPTADDFREVAAGDASLQGHSAYTVYGYSTVGEIEYERFTQRDPNCKCGWKEWIRCEDKRRIALYIDTKNSVRAKGAFDGAAGADLLRHEQYHYYIAFAFVRGWNRKLDDKLKAAESDSWCSPDDTVVKEDTIESDEEWEKPQQDRLAARKSQCKERLLLLNHWAAYNWPGEQEWIERNQIGYDRDTAHGTKRKEQAAWEKKVDNWLK